MKLQLRRAVWALALAFTMAVLVTPLIVTAQSEQGLEHGRGHDKSDQVKDSDGNSANSSSYQQGWNHGQEDRANNRVRLYHVRFDNDRDRRAYESGYDQGYQGNGTYQGQNGHYPDRNAEYGRDGQRNEPYRNRTYGNGPSGNNLPNVAYNNGFQTGMGYGQADRNNGHSNRPTYSSTYQIGTKGYNSSYGSQTAYKNSFRQGYQAGYARGYDAGQTQGYRR